VALGTQAVEQEILLQLPQAKEIMELMVMLLAHLVAEAVQVALAWLVVVGQMAESVPIVP
jgi:hypothetical protein